jgi:hypothetical protein
MMEEGRMVEVGREDEEGNLEVEDSFLTLTDVEEGVDLTAKGEREEAEEPSFGAFVTGPEELVES